MLHRTQSVFTRFMQILFTFTVLTTWLVSGCLPINVETSVTNSVTTAEDAFVKIANVAKSIPSKSTLKQPLKDAAELIKQAEEVSVRLRPTVETLAKKGGGTTVFPPKPKELKRVFEKGEPETNYDYARATILVPYRAMPSVLDGVLGEFKGGVIRMKDRINVPLSGYRDIMLNVKDPVVGHISEILLMTHEMSQAKFGEGHKLYELIRPLSEKAEKLGRNALTPTEQKIWLENEAKMKALYDAAHVAAMSK